MQATEATATEMALFLLVLPTVAASCLIWQQIKSFPDGLVACVADVATLKSHASFKNAPKQACPGRGDTGAEFARLAFWWSSSAFPDRSLR